MLGKLIKHEWKSTYKIGCLLLGSVVIMTAISCISLRTPFLYKTMSGDLDTVMGAVDVMSLMTLILYFIMMAGVTYALLIYQGVHFYKSMYTDEGYLLHTLPVTNHQILISKILVGTLWVALLGLSIVISLIALGYTAVCLYMATTPARVTQVLMEVVSMFFQELPAEMSGTVTHLVISLIAIIVLSPFGSVITLFGSITLGQLFTKHRGLMAIVCYIGVGIVSSVLAALFSAPLAMRYVFSGINVSNPIEQMISFVNYYASLYDLSSVMLVLTGAVLYGVSWLILTKKFDIE